MRMLRLAGWLAAAPLLAGCLTSNTVNAIKTPTQKRLHDYVDRLERVSMTESNQLLIFFEGRLTNSPRRGQYTMVVPLMDAEVKPYRQTFADTNVLFTWSQHRLPRSGIVEGWAAREGPTAVNRAVEIGPPILHGCATNVLETASRLKAMQEADRTLVQVVDMKTSSVGYPDPVRFIYVDAAGAEAFTDIRVEEEVVMVKRGELRWVLPLAVVGDVATFPLQAIYLLVYFASGGH